MDSGSDGGDVCSQQTTYSISETGQDRSRVTIDCLYKVTHELSIGAKIDDFKPKRTAAASHGLVARARYSISQ